MTVSEIFSRQHHLAEGGARCAAADRAGGFLQSGEDSLAGRGDGGDQSGEQRRENSQCNRECENGAIDMDRVGTRKLAPVAGQPLR